MTDEHWGVLIRDAEPRQNPACTYEKPPRSDETPGSSVWSHEGAETPRTGQPRANPGRGMDMGTAAEAAMSDVCAWAIAFTVPGRPVPYTRMVRGDRSARAARYRAYKELVGHLARQAGAEVWGGPIGVSVTIDHGRDRMRRRWDCDNVLKGCIDSLQGVCFENDRQVTSASVRIFSRGPAQVVIDVMRLT